MKKTLMVMALTFGSVAFAQDTKETKAPRAPTQRIVFGDEDLIEANLSSPEVEVVQADQRTKHASIIRVRENFDREVMESVGQL